MISYDFPLYRPPSEAESLIFQVTLGCSHNRCRFCSMYQSKRFCIRPEEEILTEIQRASFNFPQTRRVFLADGDALVLKTPALVRILSALKTAFPGLRRVSTYANARNLLSKSPEELSLLCKEGLSLVYLGLESGDAEILKRMEKGSTPEENIEAVLKARAAGLKTSVMVISGLGGKTRSREHALTSAAAVSAMNPDFFSVLTLYLTPESPLKEEARRGDFLPLNPTEALEELALMLENIKGQGILFRSNHASNYLNLAGVLDRDQEWLLSQIRQALKSSGIRPEIFRGL